ncbi:MAG: hypothetical protein WBG46_01750 [Nonlabens sp.]
MKYLALLFLSAFLFSCNNDDDVSEPEPEPIVANAKILTWGRCTPDHNTVELYDPDFNILPSGSPNRVIWDMFDIPEAFWQDDLEVYIEYEVIPENERMFCPSNYIISIPLRIVSIELPTTEPEG